MPPAPDHERAPAPRRVPQQVRSRDRVARILEAASRIVVAGGVEAINTRSVASAAGLPVASLYQYFADKESILLAIVERDVAALEAQVHADLGQIRDLTVGTMVETIMRAFVKVYHQRPSFVVIWMRGRTNAAVSDFVRSHNRRMAHDLFEVARSAGMVEQHSDGLHAELAIEVADRVFQLAFEQSLRGDPRVIDEGIAMVTAYLEAHSTPLGTTGVRR
jgi:AcrR family transcriptional regulator